MATGRVERRLAAILAADVAGYSRLMGADEEGTLARLKALRREVADPKIREHRGRIVKTTGDGLLLEFASVVDAVRCAVEVQREIAERNADVPTDFTARPKPPPSRGPIDTAQVTFVLVASFFCCLATKSSAPPKQAA